MKMQVSDYAEWLTGRYWTDIEASFLLCGLRPYYGSLDERNDSEFTRFYSPYEREKVRKIHNLILDAIHNGHELLPHGCDFGCSRNLSSVLSSQTPQSRQIAESCMLGYGTKPVSVFDNVLIPHKTHIYQHVKTVYFLTNYDVWQWATARNRHISTFDSGKWGVGNLTPLAIAMGVKFHPEIKGKKRDLKLVELQENALKQYVEKAKANGIILDNRHDAESLWTELRREYPKFFKEVTHRTKINFIARQNVKAIIKIIENPPHRPNGQKSK